MAHDDTAPLSIGRDCTLERCILDKNVHLGDGVIIRRRSDDTSAESALYWIRDGITLIPSNTLIPAGTVI